MSDQKPSPETILAAALEIADPVARRAYLDRACGGDVALRQEVESLLEANAAAGEFLLRPAGIGAGAGQKTVSLSLLSETTGTRIGRYKLLEQIGEGGFGVVWMAEQEEPVRRRGALKIIKLGMDTKEVVARFDAERQALAMMDHPHIASVFDGGATDTGRPYFVMELVKGVPLTDYCDANQLSTRKRLELFMQVCQAVQHAHQKGVIHRDLKPSNVLVTEQDDRPVPKVIDFGVAKATQVRLTEKTLFTRFGQWIGTPAYMSPEQAGLGSLDVDTRSDIYSLGVLLYELLTGRTPFDTQKLMASGYDAVMRTIREEEPPKPSTRLSTLAAEELSTVATKRGAEPAKLGRLVRGDLDWIVMKTLEKDRQRRYDTPSSLAKDIERHLHAEPVLAVAPTLGYRLAKFTRRNRTRLAFTGFALVAVALAVAVGKFALSSEPLPTGTNAVFLAAKSDDATLLHRLLDGNPSLVNQRDADGATPLAYAADAGSTNALRLLLARGAYVDATNNAGSTPLITSAAKGHVSTVAMLLEAGATVNHAANGGETALGVASLRGVAEVGRLLLNKGARTEATGMPGKATALKMAATFGHAAFTEVLLAHGARTDSRDAVGNTPLHGAALGLSVAGALGALQRQLGSLTSDKPDDPRFLSAATVVSNQMAQLQADLPAEMLGTGRDHRRVAELLLARSADLEATNGQGCTPLHSAALCTNRPVAEVLVTHKANLHARAYDGSTPLELAALKGGVAMVELLLNAGANPDLQDYIGFTALNTAAEHGQTEVLRLLLAYGANPNLSCPSDRPSSFGGQAPLHSAALRGDVEMMRLLLDKGALPNLQSKGGTPLCFAARGESARAVEFLLDRGALPDIHAGDPQMAPLHWAAILGQPKLAALLLKRGATNNIPSEFGTPMHTAAWSEAGAKRLFPTRPTIIAPVVEGQEPDQPWIGSDGDHVTVLKLLLASGADVNGRDHELRTPLIVAASQGNVGAVEALLAAKADLAAANGLGVTALHAVSDLDAPPQVVSNIVTRLLRAGASLEARDERRGTPLHRAAAAGRPAMVAVLLEALARTKAPGINATGPALCTPLQLAVMGNYREVVELLVAKGADLEWHCQDNAGGTTALQQAVQVRARDIAELLLDHGANVNATAANGATALVISAGNGDVRTMKLLLEHGAQLEQADRSGRTALIAAALAGRVDAAELLLERGAKLGATDQEGGTAFIKAAKVGQLEMVKFLLEQGAPIAATNHFGFTALHEAADRGYPEVVRFLLDSGMKVDLRSAIQYTPLHCAANAAFTNEIHYVAVVRVLLDHRADLNARERYNLTPLHFAAVMGRPQIIKILLAAKADPQVRDISGKTALDWAIARQHSDCVELLRSARQVHTPDAIIQKPNQSTNPPPKKLQDSRQAAPAPERLAASEGAAEGQPVADLRARAEKGDARAQFKLGDCYRTGEGVTRDIIQAVDWYRRAAEHGDAGGQNALGVCYLTGTGVVKDAAEALKWLRQATEQGLAKAQCNLGNCYYSGTGVAKDPAEAVPWFRKAADQEYVEAQYNLGVCYQEGQGVTTDPVEAAKWFRRAAEQGFVTAQNDLGLCYVRGEGVVRDDVEAYKWLSLARAQGDEHSPKALQSLGGRMTPEQIAEARRLAQDFKPRKALPPNER